MMQDKFNQEVPSPSDEENLGVTPEFREALAVYFERKNGSLETVETAARLSQPVVALLALPERWGHQTPNVDAAWQRFQQRAFSPATQQAASLSLGGYVSQALTQSEASTVVESGLPKATLEAITADSTSLDELKGYQLNDYADLARRYGVKDSAFPRMLRWLKGLGKSFALPSLGSSGGMVFAREEEVRQPGLSEAELAELSEKLENQPEQASESDTEKE
jgi:hypothetical protein